MKVYTYQYVNDHNHGLDYVNKLICFLASEAKDLMRSKAYEMIALAAKLAGPDLPLTLREDATGNVFELVDTTTGRVYGTFTLLDLDLI